MKQTTLPYLLALALLVLGTHSHAQHTPAPVPADSPLPPWPKPTQPDLASGRSSIRSQDLEILQSTHQPGGLLIKVAGQPMAIGQNHPRIGYLVGAELHWLDAAQAPGRKFALKAVGAGFDTELQCADADGGHWTFRRRFSPGHIPGSIDIESTVSVDQPREVALLPMLMIFPGVGTFGTSKGQGLFAGLEYLENEPSSSEADIIGPASKRQVPDNLKVTLPLMVIQSGEGYVALTWQMRPQFCALYDSPDRLFESGGHVLGVLFPGSNGQNRQEGSLLPRFATRLGPGEEVDLHATLLGGRGASVVPAVQQYVQLRGVPPVPGVNFPQYVAQAAGGWLDSKIREGKLFRHAVAEGGFPPGPAADAALWMDWLGDETTDASLAARLHQTAEAALGAVAPADWNVSGVGHVRYPVAALVYGHVAEAAERARQNGEALLARFEPDLSIQYRPAPTGPDYSKTHYSKEADGYTSRPVLDLLEDAAFCGEPTLLAKALQRLRAMDKFSNGVPRGAQTWECPLHIPDILAAAQMVRAYLLGYELTGEPHFLEQARYWAWTGVPFVYLVNPTSQPIGDYGTIAVFGATQWRAPVWLGLPVQWCGLVYADALHRLMREDPTDGLTWKKLADGITVSGIQQSWPSSDTALQGLLPDSFVLRTQHRNGPAINPATLEANAFRLVNQPPVYDFWAARDSGLRIHAPGGLVRLSDNKAGVSFEVYPWMKHPYYVLINGLTAKPALKLNGQPAACADPHQFQEKEGRLILKLDGKTKVELELSK